MFGTVSVWRGQNRVAVSDPSRTVIDVLDDPRLGGGIRTVADVLREYLQGEHRDDDQLVEYGDRLGNRAAYSSGSDTSSNTPAPKLRASSRRASLDAAAGSPSSTRPPRRMGESSAAGVSASTSLSADRTAGHRRAGRRMAAHRGGDRKGLPARLAPMGNRSRPGPRRSVDLQGWHLPEEVLHRDLPVLRGP